MEQGTTKEKIQSVIIAILSIIIVFGGAFFASELKYCKVEELVSLESISFNNFTTLLNDDAASIIYIGRPDCGYCQQQEPIMKQVATEHELNIFYLNANELTAKDSSTLFALDEKIFGKDGKEFGTPTTLIVKKGKIVEGSVGLMQKADLVKFLTKHEFIK